jgi:Tfp pilus assembly protein PilP
MRILSLTFIAFTLGATLAHAQAAPAQVATVQTTPAAPGAAAAPAEAQPNDDEPQGFNYNAEGRRDPFVTLLRRGADTRGPKIAGLGGLGTAEVSLRGVLTSQGGFVGILQGVDARNYIVRVGDRLSDGTIRSITADSMVILQQVNDPLSLEKQREVRKLLRQTEEAK